MTRIGPDGNAVAPWPAGGRRIREPATGSPNGGPLPDGAGGAYVVIGETKAGEPHLWAHHLTAEGSPVPGWPVEGFQLDSPGFLPQSVVADGLGGLIVVGREALPSGIFELRARRWTSSATTAPGWPSAGVVVRSYSGTTSVSLTSAVGDGQGGVYLAWDTYVPAGGGHGGGFP